MRINLLCIAFLLLIGLCGIKEMKAQIQIEGEIRPRFEFRDGYKKFSDSTTTPNYVVSQRTRLNFKYKKERIISKLSIQDARIWGEEPLKTDVPSINLYEAWGELFLIDSLSLRVGRQEIIVDNERLIGNGNWSTKGITHDAAVIKYKKGTWKCDLGAAFNQRTDTTFGTTYFTNNSSYKSMIGTYKTLNYLWVSKTIDSIKISVIGIADGYQKRGTINTLYVRGTFGGVAEYKNNNLQGIFRGFYQMGKDTIGTGIEAYYLNAEAFCKIEKLTAKAGCEYISGNDGKDTLNNWQNTFSTLYGAAHGFNGHLDYVKDIPKQTKMAGLVDIYVSLNYKLIEKLSARCDIHYLALQNNLLKVKNSLTTWDKYLGSEIDVIIKYDYSKELSIQAGYSTIFGSSTLEYLVGGQKSRMTNWAWVMLAFKPKFFDSENKDKK